MIIICLFTGSELVEYKEKIMKEYLDRLAFRKSRRTDHASKVMNQVKFDRAAENTREAQVLRYFVIQLFKTFLSSKNSVAIIGIFSLCTQASIQLTRSLPKHVNFLGEEKRT